MEHTVGRQVAAQHFPALAAVRRNVGTDFGVYVSTNGGERWEVLGGNLPSNQVSDLQFEPRDRILA